MTSMNDNKLLTGVHRGIHSPWWRTDSSWKCQSELRFPPRVSLQTYNVYCLELDRWLLQCFFLFVLFWGFFGFKIPDGMAPFYCYDHAVLLQSFTPFPSFSNCLVTIPLYQFLMPNDRVYLCLSSSKGWRKNKSDPKSAVCLNSTPLRDLDSC